MDFKRKLEEKKEDVEDECIIEMLKECCLPGTNSTMVYIDRRLYEDNLRAVISAKRKDIKERK